MNSRAVNIREELAALKKLDPRERGAYLERLIGAPSDDRLVLDERAHFITVLRKEGIWPPRREGLPR